MGIVVYPEKFQNRTEGTSAATLASKIEYAVKETQKNITHLHGELTEIHNASEKTQKTIESLKNAGLGIEKSMKEFLEESAKMIAYLRGDLNSIPHLEDSKTLNPEKKTA